VPELMADQLTLFRGPYYLGTANPHVPDPLVLYETWREREPNDDERCGLCGTYCESSFDCASLTTT
jgi:hypothetical protein